MTIKQSLLVGAALTVLVFIVMVWNAAPSCVQTQATVLSGECR